MSDEHINDLWEDMRTLNDLYEKLRWGHEDKLDFFIEGQRIIIRNKTREDLNKLL